MKEYYKNNRDEKLAKDKVRQENNKEQIATRRKERYEANRDEVLAKQSIKLTCGCGSTFRQSDRARHERTKKHTTWSAWKTNYAIVSPLKNWSVLTPHMLKNSSCFQCNTPYFPSGLHRDFVDTSRTFNGLPKKLSKNIQKLFKNHSKTKSPIGRGIDPPISHNCLFAPGRVFQHMTYQNISVFQGRSNGVLSFASNPKKYYVPPF